MVEAGVCEAFGVIDLLVQTDDGGHIVFPEVREVSFRGVEGVTYKGRSNNGCLRRTHNTTLSDRRCRTRSHVDERAAGFHTADETRLSVISPFSILVLG